MSMTNLGTKSVFFVITAMSLITMLSSASSSEEQSRNRKYS